MFFFIPLPVYCLIIILITAQFSYFMWYTQLISDASGSTHSFLARLGNFQLELIAITIWLKLEYEIINYNNEWAHFCFRFSKRHFFKKCFFLNIKYVVSNGIRNHWVNNLLGFRGLLLLSFMTNSESYTSNQY